MNNKLAAVFVFLGLCLRTQLSAAQSENNDPAKWNYTHYNPDCSMPGKRFTCDDIRTCTLAAASIALGGWPTVCGSVDRVIPKVCCGYPLALGGALMRKIEAEQDRHDYCGRAVWATKISLTEEDYLTLVKKLPEVDESDTSRFNPPLGISTGYRADSGLGYRFSKQGEYPWMVSIQENGRHVCGGSLIDATHVLTAAHCFGARRWSLDPRTLAVLAGDILRDNGYHANVKKFLVHEDYIPEHHYNDIAILTLEKEVPKLNRPVCLPSPQLSNQNLTGVNTTVLGWGHTAYRGRGTDELQSIDDIPVVTNEICRKAYSSVGKAALPNGVTNDFICAGLEDGSKDSCQNDSGGPMMYRITDYDYPVNVATERWVLVGIVSFGFRCGEPGYPGVYTRVSSFMSWILRNTKD